MDDELGKAKLIRDMASPDNQVALRAVGALREMGWLFDGSLERIDLEGANLIRADLEKARLVGANLTRASLTNARLYRADLRETRLLDAMLWETLLENGDLEGANLSGANLHAANLCGASLRGADLTEANLTGASLAGADLAGATLTMVEFSVSTVLPDGAAWAPGADLSRFTDPAHPDFFVLNRPEPLPVRTPEEEHLIRQLTDKNSRIALDAVVKLRDLGSLASGALRGVDLHGAKLVGASLSGADLAGADLSGTNLDQVTLDGAVLENANLQGADLRGTILRGANLIGANLENAAVFYAFYDKKTILPDHTAWGPAADMLRFSDPAYDNFWRSDDPASPACRRKNAS